MRTLAIALLFAATAAADELKYLPADEVTGGASAVIVGDVPLVHTAQFAAGPQAGEAGPAPAELIDRTLRQALAAVGASGGTEEGVLKLNVSVARPDLVGPVREAIAKRFPDGKRPAVGFVVGKLPVPGAVVAIDAVAPVTGRFDGVKQLRGLKGLPPVGGAPAAVLPAGRRVYVSGQAEKGVNPVEATRKTLASLRSTLKWLGLDDNHVVQCKAFLTPMSAARDVVKEFDTHFGGKTPPLVLVEWESSLPIEIELIATAPGGGKAAEVIEFLTPPGMTASPIYSRVTRVAGDRFIYTSGLVSPKPGNGAEQVEGVFERLRGILKDAGSDFNHLAKATYYVADDDVSGALNRLRPRYYDPKRPPAASKAKVAGVGVKDRTLVLDLIAVPARK